MWELIHKWKSPGSMGVLNTWICFYSLVMTDWCNQSEKSKGDVEFPDGRGSMKPSAKQAEEGMS